MKRSPMKPRKTYMPSRKAPLKAVPLKPGKAMKRCGKIETRKDSPATVYYNRICRVRDAWRTTVPQKCMGCGETKGLETHEIERRSQAPGRWGQMCNYLLLCGLCHHGPFDSLLQRPHAYQLAIKSLKDGKRYRLARWLKVGDKKLAAPNRVTQAEVDAFYKELSR